MMEYLPQVGSGCYCVWVRLQSAGRTFPRCRLSGDAGHLQKIRDSARAQAVRSLPDVIQSGVGPEIIYSRGVSLPSCYLEWKDVRGPAQLGGFQNTASPSQVPPSNRERGARNAPQKVQNLVGPELSRLGSCSLLLVITTIETVQQDHWNCG